MIVFKFSIGNFELPCLISQGAIYFLLAIGAFLNFIAFAVTRRHCYLYLIVAFGAYLGFFRTRIRKKFNIIVGVFCNCLWVLCCYLWWLVLTFEGCRCVNVFFSASRLLSSVCFIIVWYIPSYSDSLNICTEIT